MIRRDTDTSFDEQVLRHRILQAQTLLVTSPDQTIPEIALAVGFESARRFNAAFQRHTGRSPRQFRIKGAD